MDTPQLWVPTPARVFRCDTLEQLLPALRHQSRQTKVIPLYESKTLELREDGTLRGLPGYRFTQRGFIQVCGAMIPHLSPFLQMLVRRSRQAGSTGHAHQALASAIVVFNQILRTYFTSVLRNNYQVLCNVEDKAVDGLMGSQYEYLENVDFTETIQTMLQASPLTVTLYEAAVVGRYMRLDFRSDEPIFSAGQLEDGGPDQFYAGYRFINAEVTRQTSVQAWTLMQRAWGGGTMARRGARRGRVQHKGSRFLQRIKQLLKSTCEDAQHLSGFQDAVVALQRQRLGYTGNESKDATLREKWCVYLAQLGVDRQRAKDIVASAYYFNAYQPISPEIRPVSAHTATSRTRYDLWHSLTHHARLWHDSRRERLEYAAFRLLGRT